MKPATALPRIPSETARAIPAVDESDEALMVRFCQGESQAFDALFSRHARTVNRYLLRLVGSAAAADDLTQVTFLSLVRSRGRYTAGRPLKPWLFAIATNAARDHGRRKRPEELTPEGELPKDAAAPAAREGDEGMERAVRKALSTLPEAQREAIALHHFEGLSFSEVAEAVGASESAVKVRAHRGYVKLRELLRGVWRSGDAPGSDDGEGGR